MRALLIALALLMSGCVQLHYYDFANCAAYDVRTSRMPWNPVHRMTICWDREGAHYFSETGTTANLTDILSAPVSSVAGKIPTPMGP